MSAIGLSTGTLSPTFAAATVSYTTTLPFASASFTLSATPSNANASLSINGETVSSGQASSLLALNPGSSVTYDILVTAENGTTTKTYSVAATRSTASTNDLLSNLTHTAGTLNQTFSSNTLLYTSTVPFATTSTQIVPTLADTKGQVKVNGIVVTSGQQSQALQLSVGLNEFTIETLSESQTSTKSYVLRITRSAASSNADLSGFTLSGINFAQSFASATTAYTATVASTVTSTRATATLADATATLRINGLSAQSGQAGNLLGLVQGSNQVLVEVTAQDGTTQKTYQATITKQTANPQLDVNAALTVQEGGFNTIARGNLSAIDEETNNLTTLTYVVTTLPQNGTLFIDQDKDNVVDSGENVVLNGSFTQSQINDDLIRYTHNGSETTSDSFAFTLSDPDGGSVTILSKSKLPLSTTCQ